MINHLISRTRLLGKLGIVVIVCLALSGCGVEQPSPAQANVPRVAPTVPLDLITPVPERSPTPMPAIELTPTATPAPTPRPAAARTSVATATTATPQGSVTSGVVHGRQLDLGLVSADELPAGWSAIPFDDRILRENGAIECDGTPYVDTSTYIDRAGAEFARDDPPTILFEALFKHDSALDAEKEMDFAHTVYTCHKWSGFISTDGSNVTYTVTPLQLPKVGDDSVYSHLSLQLSGDGTVEMDQVYLRIGVFTANIAVMSPDQGDPQQSARLINQAVAKLENAGF